MPTYTIKDSDKDEIFDTICTYDELQVFLENNPQCQKVITAPNIVSGNGPKSDGGFNETMAKIEDSHPNSPLADKYGSGQSNAQIKARNVINKYK